MFPQQGIFPPKTAKHIHHHHFMVVFTCYNVMSQRKPLIKLCNNSSKAIWRVASRCPSSLYWWSPPLNFCWLIHFIHFLLLRLSDSDPCLCKRLPFHRRRDQKIPQSTRCHEWFALLVLDELEISKAVTEESELYLWPLWPILRIRVQHGLQPWATHHVEKRSRGCSGPVGESGSDTDESDESGETDGNESNVHDDDGTGGNPRYNLNPLYLCLVAKGSRSWDPNAAEPETESRTLRSGIIYLRWAREGPI